MVTIQTALETITLEKYAESFQTAGISTLEELLGLTNDQLTSIMTNINMLKGHTFKLRKFIDDTRLKGFNPNPQPVMTSVTPKIDARPEIPENLNTTQTDTASKQLNGMVNIHDQISGALKMIAEIDLSKYKKAIEEIEKVQMAVKAHLGEDVEMKG